MHEFEVLKSLVEERAEDLRSSVEELKTQLLTKIENAKVNNMQSTMDRILSRLDAIEARLPEAEED